MSAKLRIPIARLGRWNHNLYKNSKGESVVEFTQEDFDSIISVFNSDDRGYEPYLTYGHIKRNFDKFTIDGFPVVGYLDSIEQVEDVLFGDFIPLNDRVVEEIQDGNYRYSSGEFIPNAKAKKSDEVFRMFLKGVALTNTPFVPNLPVNQVNFELLSDHIANQPNVCYNQLEVLGDGDVAPKDHEGPSTEMSEETRLESTQENVVEQTEDVKEIKSMLSDFTAWMKSMFTAKEAVEVELTDEQETPVVIEEETQVVEEIEEVEEIVKPEAATVDAEMASKLAAMEDEKAKLEAAARELAEKVSALEQEKLAAQIAAAEQQLSDKVADLTNKFGLAPAVAEKVKSLASSSAQTVISLSDGNQINLADAVLDLVSDLLDDSNKVELDQVGATGDVTALSDDADNPWADVIKKYRDKQSK